MNIFKKKVTEINALDALYTGTITQFLYDVKFCKDFSDGSFGNYDLVMPNEETFEAVYSHLTEAGRIYWEVTKNVLEKIKEMMQ